MSKEKLILFLGAFLFLNGVFGNDLRRAGVAFRFDDNRPVEYWKSLAGVFERNGCRMSLAVNSRNMINNKNAHELLKALSEKGHSIMDHTPNHSIYNVRARNDKEFREYMAHPGVDHGDHKTKFVYLKYELNENHPENRTFQGEIRDGVLCEFPEKLKKQLRNSLKIYLPAAKKVYGIRIINGKRTLADFWGEKTAVADFKGEIVILNSIQPANDSLHFLAEASKRDFENMGLPAPKAWIRPGGWEASISVEKFRNTFGKKYGYISADCVADRSWGICCMFGDPEPETGRFSMHPDYAGDSGNFALMKAKIAEAVAKNQVKVFISHMIVSRAGGMESFLRGYDNLLQWLKARKIPVRTQEEWADILYSGKTGPMGNVLPSFKNDLDDDGSVDGYKFYRGAKADLTAGTVTLVPGGVVRITGVAGLEKGVSHFSLAASGEKGDALIVDFVIFPSKGKAKHIRKHFKLSGASWETFKGTVNVAPDAVTLTFSVMSGGKRAIMIKDPVFKK